MHEARKAAGMSEKSRLTYRFIQRTLRQYEEAESDPSAPTRRFEEVA
jgi:hypothetical protein